MFIRENQMREDLVAGMRGGQGKVRILHLFDEKNDLKGHSRLFARVIMEKGSSIGLHSHEQEEEIYYILKGRGRVVDTHGYKHENTYEVGPGDAVLTGDGNDHSIESIGDEPLEFMAVILTY